jgi:PAS domain S-box-containing protein
MKNITIASIISQAPVAMALLTGADMRVSHINDRFLELWGKDTSVIGKPILEALPEMEGQAYPEILQEVYRTGETYFGNEARVYLFRRGRLEEGYYNFINQAFRDENDVIAGVFVVAVEVTEQVQARNHMEKAYDQARLSREAASLGMFDMDLISGRLEWDDRCRELFGISHRDGVSYEKDFISGLHPADKDRVLANIADVMIKSKTGGNYDVEYRTVGAEDGKIRWVRAKGKAYFEPDDKPFRFIGVVIDITEQKLNEQRKNDFIAMASHELKTPLTSVSAIVQFAALKLRNSDDTFLHTAMDRALVQSRKMARMISGFLDASRLESGALPLDFTAFNLAGLLQECAGEARLINGDASVIAEELQEVTVFADRDKIASVISNLISNAIKYSPLDKNVKICCRKLDGNAVVSVTDQGIGIPAADIPHLFDRYYRAENKHTSYIAGFGIGLYISAEIIKLHQGTIWVESKPGIGSSFFFSLPAGAARAGLEK